MFMRRIIWVIALMSPRSNMEPPVPQKVLIELLPALNKILEIDDVGVIIDNS